MQETTYPDTAVLLINIGSPELPDINNVRKFLIQFLTDKRVITINAFARQLLVRCIIGVFRSRKSAIEYKRIWTKDGSPLIVHSQKYAALLQQELGNKFKVYLAMRYSKPDIGDVLADIKKQNFRHIIIFPMYPHNASSTTGSSVEEALWQIGRWDEIPGITVIPAFFDSLEYISAFGSNIGRFDASQYDAVIFSYHGLPNSHLPQCSTNCLGKECTSQNLRERYHCYKYQCYSTTRSLAIEANIPSEKIVTTFQSRLSKKWITPFTDTVISQLRQEGKQNILVICPSFTVDCLETIGEIGFHLREKFIESGGKQFDLVPSLNESSNWVSASAQMIRRFCKVSAEEK